MPSIEIKKGGTNNKKLGLTGLKQNNKSEQRKNKEKCKHINDQVCFFGSNDKCKEDDIVYEALVKNQTKCTEFEYIGFTSSEMRQRKAGHDSDFKNKTAKTPLSNKVKEIKSDGDQFTIKWTKIQKAKSYRPGNRTCALCNCETYHILFNLKDKNRIRLNKKSEIWGHCRHKDRWKVKHNI